MFLSVYIPLVTIFAKHEEPNISIGISSPTWPLFRHVSLTDTFHYKVFSIFFVIGKKYCCLLRLLRKSPFWQKFHVSSWNSCSSSTRAHYFYQNQIALLVFVNCQQPHNNFWQSQILDTIHVQWHVEILGEMTEFVILEVGMNGLLFLRTGYCKIMLVAVHRRN